MYFSSFLISHLTTGLGVVCKNELKMPMSVHHYTFALEASSDSVFLLTLTKFTSTVNWVKYGETTTKN